MMFFINVKTSGALTAGTSYSTATIPHIPQFGTVTNPLGVATVTTAGAIVIRPIVNVPADTTLYFRGALLL